VILLVLREKENLSSPGAFGALTCTVDKTCHSVQLSAVPSNLPLMTSRRKKIYISSIVPIAR